MNSNEHIQRLMTAFEAGRITRAEFDELHQQLADRGNDQAFSAWIDDRLAQEMKNNKVTVNRQRIFNAIVADPRFRRDHKRPKTPRLRHQYWLAGAAALLCVGIGLWWMLANLQQAGHPPTDFARQPAQPISFPNADKPTLRLSDGTTIDLETMQNGVVATEAGASVILEGQELVYHPQSGASSEDHASHSIHIPKGMQYQLTLPDGSRVWLNAASSITFPVRFADNKRVVELSGEAFFDIEHDTERPFIVQTRLQTLAVLGTTFNVSAYTEDGYVKTSLVTGSVRVDRLGHDEATVRSLVLKPGEEAVAKQDNQLITRHKVNTRLIAAWRKGLFTFHNEPVEEVMRKVARWYDIEVEYRDGMAGKRIGGSVPRFDDIHRLMRALQATGLIHYKMEGGKVVITK